MNFRYATVTVAAAWILAIGMAGLIADVTSVGGAAALVGVALLPPALMLARRDILSPRVAVTTRHIPR